MIPRYSRPIMSQIWDDENRFKIWFEIEAHAADGMANEGTIPKEAAKKIWEFGQFEINRINEIEKETKDPSTVNNSLFIGSTAELQELLDKKK